MHCRHPRNGISLIELVVTLAVISVLTMLLLPAIQNARETARRCSCQNNLRNLGLALQQYEDIYSRWPVNVATPWTVALAPYTDKAFVMTQWDANFDAYGSTGNSTLAIGTWSLYSCPSSAQTRHPKSSWPLSNYPINPALTNQSSILVPDGRSNTIFISENSSSMALPWADGPALAVSATSSDHIRSSSVLFGDGRVRQIGHDIDSNVLQALGTLTGNELTTF